MSRSDENAFLSHALDKTRPETRLFVPLRPLLQSLSASLCKMHSQPLACTVRAAPAPRLARKPQPPQMRPNPVRDEREQNNDSHADAEHRQREPVLDQHRRARLAACRRFVTDTRRPATSLPCAMRSAGGRQPADSGLVATPAVPCRTPAADCKSCRKKFWISILATASSVSNANSFRNGHRALNLARITDCGAPPSFFRSCTTLLGGWRLVGITRRWRPSRR